MKPFLKPMCTILFVIIDVAEIFFSNDVVTFCQRSSVDAFVSPLWFRVGSWWCTRPCVNSGDLSMQCDGGGLGRPRRRRRDGGVELGLS